MADIVWGHTDTMDSRVHCWDACRQPDDAQWVSLILPMHMLTLQRLDRCKLILPGVAMLHVAHMMMHAEISHFAFA